MTHALSGRDGRVRCKDAGSVDSSAIGATEDTAARVHSAFRQAVLVLLEALVGQPRRDGDLGPGPLEELGERAAGVGLLDRRL
jgi:hypothetical protein